jgi:hypothetical protein
MVLRYGCTCEIKTESCFGEGRGVREILRNCRRNICLYQLYGACVRELYLKDAKFMLRSVILWKLLPKFLATCGVYVYIDIIAEVK